MLMSFAQSRRPAGSNCRKCKWNIFGLALVLIKQAVTLEVIDDVIAICKKQQHDVTMMG